MRQWEVSRKRVARFLVQAVRSSDYLGHSVALSGQSLPDSLPNCDHGAGVQPLQSSVAAVSRFLLLYSILLQKGWG